MLLLICAYLTIIVVPTFKHSTVGQMVNYCHNRGSIEFYVNGKLMIPEEMEVVRENGDSKEVKTMTEDGEFAFFSGKKGVDKYTFFATKEESERLKDIKVTFTNYNHNWWNVNNFDINFDIKKSITVSTIVAAANAQKLLIVKPGVKKAVIARTMAAVINLPVICQTVFTPVFELVFT